MSYPFYQQYQRPLAGDRDHHEQQLRRIAGEIAYRAMIGDPPPGAPSGDVRSDVATRDLIDRAALVLQAQGVEPRPAAAIARLLLETLIAMESYRTEKTAADAAAAAKRAAYQVARDEEARLHHRAQLDAREAAARRAGREGRQRNIDLDRLLGQACIVGGPHEGMDEHLRAAWLDEDERIRGYHVTK